MNEKPYLEELQDLLGDAYKVPESVKKLLTFENNLKDELYTEAFGLCTDEILEDFFYANDIDDEDITEKLLPKLIEFARADDTGGIYVFWLKDDVKNVEDAPIIWFGSEGETELVASNFKEFLAILTLVEVEYDFITKSKKFRKWVKNEFDIDPINSYEEVEKINQNAKDKFKKSLMEWFRQNGAEIYGLPENAKWNADEEKWDY